MANEVLKGRILTYVSEFVDANGYAPSYREIGAAVGVKSTSTVYDYCKRLEAEGKLDMKAKQPRAIALNRRISVHGNTAQRLRVEIADGGLLYLDCSIERTGTEDMSLSLSGVMDASQLKGSIGSVVGCRIENE